MSHEPKKNALLHIYQILHKYSDFDHRLKQEDIIRHLYHDFGIEIERKAVSRNIAALADAGVTIESGKRGYYLSEREFDDSELRLLVDGVLASKHISAKYSRELINKLCNLSNVYFRSHVKNVYSVDQWSKSDNTQFFLNIAVADDAIESGKQVEFNYNKYGIDKKLHPTVSHVVSPYQLVLHNQRYYMMAFNEKWKNIGFYRLDRITDMKILSEPATPVKSVEGYENGIDYSELATAYPYMFADVVERVEFYAEEGVVDQIVDWFGSSAHITKSNDRIKVAVRASLAAMEFWAMQYLNSVEIISPQSLRDKIKENLENATKKYS